MLEALRYAVDQINKNSSLLFGQKLGYLIYDTCRSTDKMKKNLFSVALFRGSPGLIGPPTSDESILCSPVLEIFGRPVISYYATSMDLENRGKYGNFFRTVPSDRYQVFALLDIVRHFNWTYISTVNSHGNYGQRETDYFISMAVENRICIAVRSVLPEKPTSMDYTNSIKELMSDKKSKVVILITTAEDTKGLFSAAKKFGIKRGRFVWISSTSWGMHTSLTSGLEDTANGALILNYDHLQDYGFRKYFLNLSYLNTKYVWFREFWEDVFNCTFGPAKDDTKKIACNGTETIKIGRGYDRFTSVRGVITAVNTVACVLREVIVKICPVPGINRTNCIQRMKLSRYRNYLGVKVLSLLKRNSYNCTGIPGVVSFDSNGGVKGYFEILNFRGTTYKQIGYWSGSPSTYSVGNSLHIQASILWGDNSTFLPISVCSTKCQGGEISVRDPRKPVCCWNCLGGEENEIVVNNTFQACPPRHRPTTDRAACVAIPLLYVSISDSLPVMILLLSVLGILLNTFVLGMFIKHRSTKIIKASGTELCYVILAGTYLCFLAPGAFLIEPSTISCGLRRFISGISLTTCYTPLFLKTNRLYRIFRTAKSSLGRPLLISPCSQLLICISLIGLQALLGITWTLADAPAVDYALTNKKTLVVICISDVKTLFLNLSLCFVLMAANTWYAFKTRKFPKNFNETQTIGVTMYISCMLWAIFVPLYLWSGESSNVFLQLYIISIFCDVIGFVSLIGLFGQKIMLLIYPKLIEPEEESSYNRFSTLSHGDSFLKLHDAKMRKGSLADGRECQCRQRMLTFKQTVSKYTSTADLQDEQSNYASTFDVHRIDNVQETGSMETEQCAIGDKVC